MSRLEETKEIYGIIYLIRNKINNKCYIGQTSNKRGFEGRYPYQGQGIERVYKYYKWRKDNEKHYNDYLFKSIEKYGFDAFEVDEKFDIAYSKEELNEKEQWYIYLYNSTNREMGYNRQSGGNFYTYSPESRKKMSLSKQGVYNGENNPRYGAIVTEETRRKISKANKGRIISEQQRKEHSERMRGEGNSFYGKHHTEETINKVSKGNNYRAKPVYCYEKEEIRLSGVEWEEELDVSKTMICGCCKGRQKSAKGYHFRYATEEEIKEYKLKYNIDK